MAKNPNPWGKPNRFEAVSLRVRGSNVAVRLYERVRFIKIPGSDILNRTGEISFNMIHKFKLKFFHYFTFQNLIQQRHYFKPSCFLNSVAAINNNGVIIKPVTMKCRGK
jgi:hypothetical protein